MSQFDQGKGTGRVDIWALVIAVIAVLPFILGAAALAWEFASLPSSAGSIAKAQVLEAVLFSFGFALGLLGAVLALACRSPHARILRSSHLTFRLLAHSAGVRGA